MEKWVPAFAGMTMVALALAVASPAFAAEPEPLGIALEGYDYPHPISFLPLTIEGQDLRMAYMDVRAATVANNRAVLLLHGRNFPAGYFEPTIKALSAAGYRVVVPDQIGFGKSSKPDLPYSFELLARNTAALLDHLKLPKVDIVAHSMGGMLATRFTRLFPDRVERLLLAGPIGLEDYSQLVPARPIEAVVEEERKFSRDAYRAFLLKGYAWGGKPEALDDFVDLRERLTYSAEYPRWVKAFAWSALMIQGQPTVQELPQIEQPTLILMGANDRVAPGRNLLPPEAAAKLGRNAELAKEVAGKMPKGRAVIYDGVGHLIHLEAEERFNKDMLAFLREKG